MLFDTGARFVSLRAEDAERVGINRSALNYSLRMIDRQWDLCRGPGDDQGDQGRWHHAHQRRQALLQSRVRLMIDLLGQTFMSTMAGFSTEGDKLTLRGD